MSSLTFVPHSVSSVSGHKRKHEKTHKKSSKKIKRNEESDKEPVHTGNEAVFNDMNEDTRSRSCPYLDTIRRNMLDFDFEKLCSISLSHLNVYACLICGKYFQGRGNSTHAYTHSVSESHHVFLNLETRRFYCLPDDYEILDGSLEDITYLLNPTFSTSEILALDSSSKMVRAYNGLTYYPGVVGLNNIKANDYCNVILQMLSHISPLRDYFLDIKNFDNLPTISGDQMMLLVQRFSELIRKLWNPRNFKTHVSPHEFLQAVVLCSKKRFQITEQGDAVEFLSWLVNAIDKALKVKRISYPKSAVNKTFNSIVSSTLRGKMRIYSRKIMPVNMTDEEKASLADSPEYMTSISDTNFFYLTCDLPPPPLYLDEFKENIIPQVSLATLLSKFNGIAEKEYKTHRDSTLRRFELRRLPPYLILYMKRFVKNIFTLEKNPTIVNFPIKSIDFGDLLSSEFRAKHRYTTYDLIANIVHDGPPTPGSGTHRIHLLHRGTGKWFELQDLHVSEVLPQMIPLSETLIQVWAVNKSVPNPSFVEPLKVTELIEEEIKPEFKTDENNECEGIKKEDETIDTDHEPQN
ncbi:hypothetical protein MN116_001583 [Schistosoma mekongi]|uniref:Ubiquitin carboxyl-terminal hydrolase 39 n=1 Tax=Schistosoma mekongi TaxID=38744 RepID=A0AAE1ZJD5_SCHME|nr:hypothetical protein MN116_001583 [Schistosoma mekongi]